MPETRDVCAAQTILRRYAAPPKNRIPWQNASPGANTTVRVCLYRPSEEEWIRTAEVLYRQTRTCTPEWGDAVQDAILKYLQSDTGLDYDPQRGALPTYLLGVARRLVLDGQKKQRRRAEIGGRIESTKTEAVDPRPQYDSVLYADQ